MAQAHGNEADEQMKRLDHPVVGTGHQAQLRDAERRHDQAPDEDDESKRPTARHEEPDDGENPQAYDEQAAERRVEGQERQGVARPEQYPEYCERNAEEAYE